MIGIKVIDRNGAQHECETQPEAPLMESLRDHGLVEGACGGNCACATCHVYVDAAFYAKLPPADVFETDLLKSGTHYQEGASRLSCQINSSSIIDGMVITIAPED